VLSSQALIIGAGISGLSVAEYLHRRQISFYCLDQEDHPAAISSAGNTRLFRRRHDDLQLLDLAIEAGAAWHQWERQFSTDLLIRNGHLHHGPEIEASAAAFAERGQEVPILSPEAARDHCPVLTSEFAGSVLFDPDAGAIDVKNVVRSLSTIAGNRVHLRTQVHMIKETGNGYQVNTNQGEYSCERIFLCAGHHNHDLAAQIDLPMIPEELRWHLRPSFKVKEPIPAHLSCWTDAGDVFGSGGYGAPWPDGRIYALALRGQNGSSADYPDTEQRQQLLAQVTDYARQAFPGLDLEPIDISLCPSLSLKGAELIGSDGLQITSYQGAAAIWGGNLFKFAPLLGRRLGQALGL